MKKLLNEELNRKTVEEFRKAGKYPVWVVLDNVRSLNNIGSVFRTCDAFLIEGIFFAGSQPPHLIGRSVKLPWEQPNRFTGNILKVRLRLCRKLRNAGISDICRGTNGTCLYAS